MRFEYYYSFHCRTCVANFTAFSRLYQDFTLRLDFPLKFSWAETMTMQVGLLTIHRALFYNEVNGGNYMRTYHLIRHSILDYRSPSFVQQHFYVRQRATEQEG